MKEFIKISNYWGIKQNLICNVLEISMQLCFSPITQTFFVHIELNPSKGS